VAAQLAGALAGVAAAHAMFALPLFTASQRQREGGAQAFSEFVATFGLLVVIRGCARAALPVVACGVAAYITAAYWFTASTSFANPAVTVARSLTDTFSGIRPADVATFVLAQLGGAASATGVVHWLLRDPGGTRWPA
jgi:glycerol uptake facilitator-like aquaporin